MKKQNIVIVFIVLIILTMSIGYSIFRTSTSVIGKTAVMKNLDINFYNIGKINQEGCEDVQANISDDKKSVVVNISKLEYKGAYAIIPITVENSGNIPARLESIYEYGIEEDSAINITYEGTGATDTILSPGDIVTFDLKIAWENDLNKDFESLEFLIKFNYIQA